MSQPLRRSLYLIRALTAAHPPRSLANPRLRTLHTTPRLLDVPSWPSPPIPQNPVGPSDNLSPSSPSPSKGVNESFFHQWSHSASFQAALTTVVGLGMVFAAGVGYLEWYKAHVLHRIGRAFEPGYDPALELATLNAPNSSHIDRREQPLIDRIVSGEEKGGYYLFIGPKGVGKGTMILDAMRKINADGVSFCEAHPDLEVFRLRLGKALDFDFYEDWQGSLFSRADPRNGGPALDVERALNKLEKVALRYAKKNGRPLVLAFNNIHLFPNTDEGHGLLHQLQQRAEAWAEGGILTMIFSTDDFWCLDMMKKNASRMRILSVYDLSASESVRALRHLRRQALANRHYPPGTEVEVEEDAILHRAYEMVGGRTSYLARVARADDILAEAEAMIESEKAWLLSKIGLIPEHDDDVMDEQKWASCSWLLLSHLANELPPLDNLTDGPVLAPATPMIVERANHPRPGSDEITPPAPAPTMDDIHLPHISYEEARRVMTRADFLEPLDHNHIISIDLHHQVRPDSLLLLRAAQQVVSQPTFSDDLDTTRERVDQIEGLHRQNELTIKEPFKVVFDKSRDGRGVFEVVGLGESFVPLEQEDGEGDDQGDGRVV